MNFTRENLKKIQNQLKKAFIEFYYKLRLLKNYSFLNVLAFSKIMKKYDKVTKLMERVEATFIKYFSNSNRSKGMNKLRPRTKKERHRISFSTVALTLALILLIRARDILSKAGRVQYMESMFPLYR
ncbi:hypothetical protein COLO4_00332 [Corchorus olitorius]|uniref:SPX domain-containing protein n=1 Tax=Corchorus olitorius TaxID=93759 RepID=A0A1R3L445_9ROSI|nr:hypothetical protein COLO4_00332 [Corchorus olitorius]